MYAAVMPEEEAGAGCRFELSYLTAGGKSQRKDLSQCWNLRFERVPPVRKFVSYKGQKNFTGLRWTATVGGHVGFESWLERDNLMLLDFDPAVTGISSQPFVLHWHDGTRERKHTPDYFVRRADGSALVVDVRADDRIRPEDAEAFEMTGLMCSHAGWEFRRVGELDPLMAANVRWLAGYRHPRVGSSPLTGRVAECFSSALPLFEGAARAGSLIAALPVAYHLLWHHILVTDLGTALLGPGSEVRQGSGGTK
jgi:hypothetical protein